MVKIVFMDDEPNVIRGYAGALDADGHDVSLVQTSADLKSAFEKPIDIAILDVNLLPGMLIEQRKAEAAEKKSSVFIPEEEEGYRVLEWIKRNSPTTGVIMLTAQKIELGDRIRGLDTGADDYLQKGIDVLEFRSRVRSLARRLFPNARETFKIASLFFDTGEGKLSSGTGNSVELTTAETKLLERLCSQRGKVISRTDLYRAVFDADLPSKTDRAIDNLVSKLRAKVERKFGCEIPVTTVYGSGYRLYG